MKKPPIIFAGMMLWMCVTVCRADELASTTQPAPQAATLPASALRGMDTDRPNVTNTPHTIDAGHLQIETGFVDYSHYRNRSEKIRADDLGLGQFNFRLGVLEDLEVNAVVDSFEAQRTRDDVSRTTTRAKSFGDTVLGAKLNLWGDQGGDDVWASALAIQPQFKFPTARDTVGNGHFEFSVAAPFLVNLPDGFHLGLQSGISDDRSIANIGYVTGFDNSISVDRVVVDKLDVYLEYASEVTTERHTKTIETIDVGATYPLSDNIVVDGGVNFGLNHATDNIEMLAGISVRF